MIDVMWLRWKAALTLDDRWEVYRHDGQQSWYVGAADTNEAAWVILESDRAYWLQNRHAREIRGPQNYATTGVWD